MERADDKRLEELRNSGKTVYSISRLDSINNCLYGAYRTYILKDRGNNNVYAIMGGKIHDVLEGITNGVNTESDLLPAMNDELTDMEMLGISFPSDSIKDGWVKDMTHFCNTYKAPNGELVAEQLFIYETPNGNFLQGYIDLTKINNDGTVSIYDYKTSSMYKGEEIKNHGRQLLTYAIGLEQAGYKVKDVAWIMLKFCEVRFMGKKTSKSKEKTLLSKVIERKKLADELSKYIEQDLYELGIDDVETEIILNTFKASNDLNDLPEDVRNKYTLLPYVMKYELTDEVRKECEEYIDTTIKMWESLDPEDVNNFPPKKFTRLQKNGKEVDDSFFCNCLCSHSKNCPYLKDYLISKDAQNNNEDDDLF